MALTILHAQQGIPWQKRYAAAFAKGLKSAGHDCRVVSDQSTTPGVHIVLGPNCFKPAFAKLRAENRDVLTVNRAFIGSVLGHEEDPFVAIGWNGYNNNARFPFDFGDALPYSRARDSFWKSIKPAKPSSGPVLILGEYETPESYLRQAIVDCEAQGLNYWFRPHPNGKAPNRAPICPAERLKNAIRESSIVLTHHSTAACEALLRGVPVICYDEESMCWPVCPHSPFREMTDRRLPDRTAWVEWLAWTQWTVKEIAAGEPWQWVEIDE